MPHKNKLNAIWMLCLLAGSVTLSWAQDAREALGPKDKGQKNTKSGEHPLEELMRTKNSRLRADLKGQHPRVFVTQSEIETLRERAKGTHRELWQKTVENVRALKQDPPPAPAQERRAQNDVGIAIAEAALAYRIEGDQKYFDAAKKYLDAAVSYDVWGYTSNKPNVDLAAGHLLYGMGWGYDLLYKDLKEADRARYREKLSRQARLLFEYYKPKPGRTYSYSQNHVFIPMAGLAVAAYALYDEVEDAPQWAALARAIYDRVLATYSPDGYYYEGFEYWIFSTPWIVHYLDAHAHATGEDLYNQPGLRLTYKYVAHSLLPDGKYIFDFGDVYEGPITRAGKGDEYKRANPEGRFHTNYNLLYRLASRYKSGEIQGVAEWMKELDHYNAEEYWSLLWYDDTIKAIPIEVQPKWHHFADHGVVYWRNSWIPGAMAFAFKCGPPEGHHTNDQLKQFPDWHLSSGHAHPDAASFIIYADGRVLTGDTGYAGVPMTEHHNTVLIDGKGQAKEGKGHDAFDDVPYDRLNRIKILEASLTRDSAVIRADATSAYEPELGLTSFVRTFTLKNGKFEVLDELSASKPVTFASLLHADSTVRKLDDAHYLLMNDASGLRVDIDLPRDARSRVVPNLLTAAGAPGSVDKGERQQRGERLEIMTASPSQSVDIKVTLTPQRSPAN